MHKTSADGVHAMSTVDQHRFRHFHLIRGEKAVQWRQVVVALPQYMNTNKLYSLYSSPSYTGQYSSPFTGASFMRATAIA